MVDTPSNARQCPLWFGGLTVENSASSRIQQNNDLEETDFVVLSAKAHGRHQDNLSNGASVRLMNPQNERLHDDSGDSVFLVKQNKPDINSFSFPPHDVYGTEA